MAIITFSPFGYDGSLVTVEVDLRKGIPAFDIVGLSDACVAETRERVRSAIKNSNLDFPMERVLISLSPADLKKEGGGFDLPIALEILRTQKNLTLPENILVMGELELSGCVRNVRAVTAALQTAWSVGTRFAIVPHSDNLKVPLGMKVKTVGNLTEANYALTDFANEHFETFIDMPREYTSNAIEFNELYDGETSLDDIHINEGDKVDNLNGLKFAMAVAVAGRHSLLAYGRPGCGKTMALQCMPQLMPKLLDDEASTVDRIYSVAGLSGMLKDRRRPFRMPHQTASIEGICGGGINCRPGEISLAHNGVLFLDEAAEFRTSVLQMLRVPLETKNITLARAGRSTVYPANFQLVMATNPCPCGNYGEENRICLCSARSIELYWKKFSGPLLDRVAIRWSVAKKDEYTEHSLEELRGYIKNAWQKQLTRANKFNNDLDIDDVNKFIKLPAELSKVLTEHAEKYGWTARTVANITKVAQTLADMECFGTDVVTMDCLKTAIDLHGSTPLEMM